MSTYKTNYQNQLIPNIVMGDRALLVVDNVSREERECDANVGCNAQIKEIICSINFNDVQRQHA